MIRAFLIRILVMEACKVALLQHVLEEARIMRKRSERAARTFNGLQSVSEIRVPVTQFCPRLFATIRRYVGVGEVWLKQLGASAFLVALRPREIEHVQPGEHNDENSTVIS